MEYIYITVFLIVIKERFSEYTYVQYVGFGSDIIIIGQLWANHWWDTEEQWSAERLSLPTLTRLVYD